MAKKKKSIELSSQNINFSVDKISYRAIRYYPTAMTIDVMVTDAEGVKLGMQNISFAHVPREIKKIIKPN